ncbi:hypothetical protein BDP27DRAFT_1366081 [Rhodocollybia butyracea]|nr:hypothetical protein BDP27DRAFT_1366081 [Rhodocollybia butyracea]
MLLAHALPHVEVFDVTGAPYEPPADVYAVVIRPTHRTAETTDVEFTFRLKEATKAGPGRTHFRGENNWCFQSTYRGRNEEQSWITSFQRRRQATENWIPWASSRDQCQTTESWIPNPSSSSRCRRPGGKSSGAKAKPEP